MAEVKSFNVNNLPNDNHYPFNLNVRDYARQCEAVSTQFAAIRCLLAIDDRMFPTLFDFHETWKINLLEFMERHFTEDMTMEEFASYTGRSLATFKRDFAKVSPLSPQKWLIEQRLERSSQLLRDSKTKPSSVYYEVGFKNRTHFSGLFKQRYGLSPAAYQQQFAV